MDYKSPNNGCDKQSENCQGEGWGVQSPSSFVLFLTPQFTFSITPWGSVEPPPLVPYLPVALHQRINVVSLNVG